FAMKAFLRLAALAAPLAGCMLPDPAPVNVDRAQLMPESAARQVIGRYFNAEWTNRPYVVCDPERAYVPISSIIMIRYDPGERELIVGTMAIGSLCRNGVTGWVTVKGLSPEAATELTTALVSLGAHTTP